MKEAALLDYYISGFWWAKEVEFTPAQTSFTMAVLHMLLDNMQGVERKRMFFSVKNTLQKYIVEQILHCNALNSCSSQETITQFG